MRQVSVALESFFNVTGDVSPGIHSRRAVRNTVIIPAYNEEMGLPVVLEKVLALIDHTYEIIVVDDGSTDATAEVAGRYPVQLICHRENQGKGKAMMTGIRAARGENVIFIDADDTYPPEGVLQIAEALEHCDMAVASRATGHQNIPAFNRIGNAIFRNSIRYIYGFKAYDPLTGLYGIKRKHIEKMNLISRGFGIESEIAIKAGSMGLKTKDIHIVYRERIGEAKLNGLRDGYRIACTIASYLPRYNPMLTFVLPGLMIFLAGLIGTGLHIGHNLTQFLAVADGAPIQSPLSLSLILSLLAVPVGFQLISFGFATKLYSVQHLNCRKGIITSWLMKADSIKKVVWGGLGVMGLSLASLVVLGENGLGVTNLLSVLSLGLVGMLAVFFGLFMHSFCNRYCGASSEADTERNVRRGVVLEVNPRV